MRALAIFVGNLSSWGRVEGQGWGGEEPAGDEEGKEWPL